MNPSRSEGAWYETSYFSYHAPIVISTDLDDPAISVFGQAHSRPDKDDLYARRIGRKRRRGRGRSPFSFILPSHAFNYARATPILWLDMKRSFEYNQNYTYIPTLRRLTIFKFSRKFEEIDVIKLIFETPFENL